MNITTKTLKATIQNTPDNTEWEIKGRVSMAALEGLVQRLNILKGYRLKPHGTIDGKFTSNVGTYYIGQAYGGYRLEQIDNTRGSARDISSRGTKKEVYAATLAQF